MSDDLLTIESTSDDRDSVVLVVEGELDPSTSPQLAERLEDDVVAGRTVVLDLSGVQFVDSSGLRTLIGASSRLGDRLVIRQPSAVVTRLFELTGIADHFVVDPPE